jgi:rubrerythrin
MALSTFGAIMGFAAEMMGKAEEMYQTLAETARDPVLKATLEGLAGEAAKNHSLMEKTRRENVTEMILEPVTGLHEEEYEINPKGLSSTGDTDLLKIALLVEEKGRKFFLEASTKLPLPEVARIFRKVGQKKEENLTRLQSLGLNQTLNKT